VLECPGDLYEELVRAHRLRWTHAEELAALTVEQLDRVVFLLTVLASSWIKGDLPQQSRPFRYPRPNAPKPRPATVNEIARFFGRR